MNRKTFSQFYLALPSPSPWNVKAHNLDDGDVLVNLTSDPAGYDVSFYIISMNKTEQSQHDHGDYGENVERYLHMVNSSENLAKVSGIPVYSEFNAVVYRVDTSHVIYKSDEFSFQTAEGGEYILIFQIRSHFVLLCHRGYVVTCVTWDWEMKNNAQIITQYYKR